MAEEKVHDYIINALNVHGSFFHKKCIDVISNVPSLEVVEKEFPVELNNEFTKIDIVAKRDANKADYYIIECKKVDNNFKTWVFFPDVSHGSEDKSFINDKGVSPKIVDAILNMALDRNDNPTLVRHFFTPKDNTNAPIDIFTCYDAYQIKFDQDKKGDINFDNIHKSAKKEDIEKACEQVLLGSRGFSNYKYKLNKKEGIIRYGYFIPIIVTTANLKICQLNTSSIGLNDGIVKDANEVKLESVPYLIYNYKPKFMLKEDNQLRFSTDHPIFQKLSIPGSIDYVMTVFIVNSNSLEDFLKKIMWS